jgi:NADH:ubiquinone oxidoreductase subunit F (NADH-binding)/NADH:ubiquinone oxidoreductase subunit E
MADGTGNEHAVVKFRSPGRGGRGAATPKGRQPDAEALDRVAGTLGDMPRRRDLLIEALHLLQDARRGLFPGDMVALAHEFRLALAEVYETATFYHHFDVLDDGEAAPPEITVRVCDSIACAMNGAADLTASLQAAYGDRVRILHAPCMGGCDSAPVAAVGKNQVRNATAGNVGTAIENGAVLPVRPDYVGFDAYVAGGGYETLKTCRDGTRTAADVVATLEDSALRGLGGAGFPTGRKWSIVRAQQAPRLMAVNADEGEPGTFKDRHFLETDPHRFLEGALIGQWAVGADECFIYLRDEYPAARQILLDEIARLEDEALVTPGTLHLRRGAGAYICGEESAMLESIEGKRGLPRHKPPFAAEIGLFGRPTLINNVETLFWVRDILEKGADWFAGHGRNGRKGIRTFSVSGRVREPGVKIAEAGITVRELIDEYCGGMLPGHNFKAYLPGGASGGILPASLGDVPLDFGTLEEHGALIGSAAVVVLSDEDDTSDAALNLMRFFEDESCGQCTPCRAGCEKAVKLMEGGDWDRPLLEELSRTMTDASICGLGQAAPNGLLSVFRHFPDDVK